MPAVCGKMQMHLHLYTSLHTTNNPGYIVYQIHLDSQIDLIPDLFHSTHRQVWP